MTCLGAVAKAQAAEFADQRAAPCHLGGGQAVVNSLIDALVPGSLPGAVDKRHLAGNLFRLHAHNGGHGLGGGVTAGGAQAHGGLPIQHRLGVSAAAGEAAATAVCPGQGLGQRLQAGVCLHIEYPVGNGQYQAEEGA